MRYVWMWIIWHIDDEVRMKWRWMVNGMLYTALKLQLNFDKRPIDRAHGSRIGMGVYTRYPLDISRCVRVCRLPTDGSWRDEERMGQMWLQHAIASICRRHCEKKNVSDVSNSNVFYLILGKFSEPVRCEERRNETCYKALWPWTDWHK